LTALLDGKHASTSRKRRTERSGGFLFRWALTVGVVIDEINFRLHPAILSEGLRYYGNQSSRTTQKLVGSTKYELGELFLPHLEVR
jgi:hypothetical protein